MRRSRWLHLTIPSLRLCARRASFAAALLLTLAAGAHAQPIRSDLWVTDGSVEAIAFSGNTAYIGGLFTRVGPPTGAAAPIHTTTGQALGLPQVVGTVYAIAPDETGGWYLGGNFTHVGGVPRSNIAHIASDYTVTDWAPEAFGGPVYTIAVGGSAVYLGGGFTTVGGAGRTYVGAVSIATGAAINWIPNADGPVFALLLSGSTVYAGGAFFNIGLAPRSRIAALSATTGVATAWNPGSDGHVYALALNGTTLYAGGNFANIGSSPRNRLAALDASSNVALAWDPNSNGEVLALAVNGGNVYVGGTFSTFGGTITRLRIAAISEATGAPTIWNPSADFNVRALQVSGGKVYAGGQFTFIGGQSRRYLAAIDQSSGTALGWDPSPTLPVHALRLAGTTTLMVGGEFTSAGGSERQRLAAIDLNTGMVTSWDPNCNGSVTALAVDGNTVYVGGSFNTIKGQTRFSIAALSATTGVPTSWNPTAGSGVLDLAVDGNTIYAAGFFTALAGVGRNFIGAIDASTGAATSWNPNANGVVRSIAIDGNTVYAGGVFTTIGGQSRNYLAALDVGGTGTATSWNPNLDNWVEDVEVHGDKVYVVGDFLFVGGQMRPRIASIFVSSNAATSWNPFAQSTVKSVVVSGSTAYFGGNFTIVSSQGRSYLAASDVSGSLSSWNPNANGTITSMAAHGSTLYVGGNFSSVGGLPTQGFVGISLVSSSAFLLGEAWDPAGISVASKASHQEMVADGAGGAVIVWQTADNNVDLHGTRVGPDGRFAPGWYPGGTVVANAIDRQSLNIVQVPNSYIVPKPSVVADGTGGFISAWSDARGTTQSIFAQRLSGTGQPQWTNNGVAIGPAAVRAGDFPVVAAGDGGAFVAWSDTIDGNSNIYASRILASGSVASGWSSRGIGVSTATGEQLDPAATSDGRGGLIVAWRDNRPGGAEGDIYIRRMNATGNALWTSGGVALCTENSEQRSPGMVTDERGGAIVVWNDRRAGGPIGRLYGQRVDSLGTPLWASDGVELAAGTTGEWDLVADGTGGLLIAWRDGGDLFVQRIGPGGTRRWGSTGVQLMSTVADPAAPRVVPDGSGGALVSWVDQEGFYTVRIDASGNTADGWTAGGTSVTTPLQPDVVAPWLASDGNGGAIVGWLVDGETNLRVQRIRYDGFVASPPPGQWQLNGVPAATPLGVQQRPAVVSNSQGGAIIVWEDYGNPEPGSSPGRGPGLHGPGHALVTGIKILESGDVDPDWAGNGNQLAPSANNQFTPVAVSDGLGGAIVAWTEVVGVGSDVRAQHIRENSVLFQGWPAGGLPLHAPGGNNSNPAIAVDGLGGAIVAWEQAGGVTGQDIVAQRVRDNGTLLWGAGGLTLCNVNGNQTRPVVIEDGSGGAYVAWVDVRGANADIYGVHVDSTGTLVTGWTAGGSSIMSQGNDQDQVSGVSDGVGGAIFAWRDARLGTRDVYAQKCSDRTPQAWGFSGVAVVQAAGDQNTPRLASDGVGGAVVAWEDLRPGNNATDLFAMRVRGTGTVDAQWPVDGVALTHAVADQMNPQVVSDAQGGVVVFWEDDRNGAGADIYAMGVQGNGLLDSRYPLDGLEVSVADGSQSGVVLTTDGSGGAVVTWSDGRGTDPDIYAMHLFGTSAPSPLAVGERLPRNAMRFAAPWPNPSRGAITFAFEIPSAAEVRLDIVDVAGRRMHQLARGATWAAGVHEIRWDGRSSAGGPAPAGIYFAQLRVGRAAVTRRFVLIR